MNKSIITKLSVILLFLIVLGIGVYFMLDFSYGKENMSNLSNIEGNTISEQIKSQYSPTIDDISLNNLTKYDSNNYNIQYHDSISDIQQQGVTSDSTINTVKFRDQTGNTIAVPVSEIQGNVTYYEPGTYRFGAASYVPSYEDSVYLSKTTGLSGVTQLYDTAEMKAGFCTQNKNSPDKLEESCRALNKNECASTSCCVLLGGSKCVYGNETGPIVKSNYSDVFVKNRDVYYYQGKCYGNCNV